MLCPVCATEMNNTNKCPFCGHVCEPGEDNRVYLNGQVIRDGHHHDWCQTTNNKNLAGQVVNGTHYHAPNPYQPGSTAQQTYPQHPYQPPQGTGPQPIPQQVYQQQQMTQQQEAAQKFVKVFVIVIFAMILIPIVLAMLSPLLFFLLQ